MQRFAYTTGIVLLSFFSLHSAQAHEINPAVIESLTGEEVVYDGHHDEEVGADPRNADRTLYSFPEWYIVYSAQEYADFVAAGNRPSQFPYDESIAQMWESWRLVEAAASEPPDSTTNTVLWTIALSFTIEYGIIGLYENTIGRISELLHFQQKTVEDNYVDQQAMTYGQFLNQTPWYRFDYLGALVGLWSTYSWSSVSPRGLERRSAFTYGYLGKALYAGLIKAASEASFEGGAGDITTARVRTSELTLSTLGIPYQYTERKDIFAVSLPRYRAFKDPVLKMHEVNVAFESIQDHQDIALSLVVPADSNCGIVSERAIFSLPLVSKPEMVRRVLLVPVTELSATLSLLNQCGLSVEHFYDY